MHRWGILDLHYLSLKRIVQIFLQQHGVVKRLFYAKNTPKDKNARSYQPFYVVA